MEDRNNGSRWSLRRVLRPALLVGAFLGLAISIGSGQAHSDKVHSAVYAYATAHPGENVPVIVQTTGPDGGVIDEVSGLGGHVTKDFTIIPGFAAQMEPQSISTLAESNEVRAVSLDAPLVSTGFIDVSKLASVYPFAVNADKVWTSSSPRTGNGVTVAVIDSGVSEETSDFKDSAGQSRFKFDAVVNPLATNNRDPYGHGTHVAGIIGGDGDVAGGKYVGIAPDAQFVDVKIADDTGLGTVSAAIDGMEWVFFNKDVYGIRVANLSFHSSVAQSFKTDPVDAAVEALWFQGVTVVAASGNMGSAPDAVSYAPANDPFIVVVGAVDDMGTAGQSDDAITTWSSRGVSQDGFARPDVVAPGRYLVSDIDVTSILPRTYPDRIVDGSYFRMSGTSMAAPVVSGIVALMLEQNPSLTPGQIKYILTKTAYGLPGATTGSGAKEVLADAATYFTGPAVDSDRSFSPSNNKRREFISKLGLIASVLGSTDPLTGQPNVQDQAALVGLNLDAVGPSGTTLSNVNWEAIKWNAIKWDAIKWDLIKWDVIKWDLIKWDAIKWDLIKWDAIKWGAIKWDAIKWDLIKWDAIKWDLIKWDSLATTDATSAAVTFSSVMLDSVGYDSVLFPSEPGDDCGGRCHERGLARAQEQAGIQADPSSKVATAGR
jgi:serine protease AprX